MPKPPDLESLAAALSLRFGNDVRRAEPMSAHTTMRVGGPADLWLAIKSVDDLVVAVTLANARQIPVFVLGGGSNLVVRQSGIRGLVIANRAGEVIFSGNRVMIQSGAMISRLARQCAEQGLSGFEWAIGVPGTIGGAVVNNAGAYGQSIADTLIRAELLTPNGWREWQPVSWFAYGYRTSQLKGMATPKPIVLTAEFALTSALPAQIEAQMQVFTQRRKGNQPPGATSGSMFKNPPGDYAGRLIEAAGLKGNQIGQAQISPVHANFFVNLGNATADDVIALIDLAQQQVLQQFGITLQPEVEII